MSSDVKTLSHQEQYEVTNTGGSGHDIQVFAMMSYHFIVSSEFRELPRHYPHSA